MNWGKGIIMVLIAFMLFIIGMSVYMFMAPVDDYDHQYYEKGLGFNHDYDREKQVVKDHAKPLIKVINRCIKFTFVQPVKGNIRFIRPSDTALDKVYNINSGKGKEVEFALDNTPAGQWQVVMEWVSNGKAYLYQQEIFIK